MEEEKKTSESEATQKTEGTDSRSAELIAKALKRQRIIIGSLATVVAVGAVGTFGYINGWFGNHEPAQKVAADIDPNADDWDGSVPEAPKGNAKAENIKLPGYPKIYLPAGQTEVEMTLGNPEGNPCFFEYTLVLKDTDEVLYESKQVPPGEAIAKATLNRALEAGEYPAVLQIKTANIATQEAMNGANMETVLVVE